MLNITIRKNTISPDLAARLKRVRAKGPLLKAVSDTLAETAKGAFNNPGLRPTSWPNKKDGSVATLRLNQLLARSPRTVGVTPRKAILGSDRKYAAVHQFGSAKKGIPARRFMPFIDRRPTALAIRRGEEALRIRLGIRR
jgi:phage gpG-like protein